MLRRNLGKTMLSHAACSGREDRAADEVEERIGLQMKWKRGSGCR
jgi:hypothetical protein